MMDVKVFLFEHNLTKEVVAIKSANRMKAILDMVDRVGSSEYNSFWTLKSEQG